MNDIDLYKTSADLFKYCRHVIQYQKNKNTTSFRIHDQEIGDLLELEPADCSHWKQGKKKISSCNQIQTIARKLDVEDKLLLDILYGRDYWEHSLEYYHTSIEPTLNSHIIKEIIQKTKEILTYSQIKEAPVSLKKIFDFLEKEKPFLFQNMENHRDFEDLNPYQRFNIAQKLGNVWIDFTSYPHEDKTLILNTFATFLLLPPSLLWEHFLKSQRSRCIVDSLCLHFQVPRLVIHASFKSIIHHEV